MSESESILRLIFFLFKVSESIDDTEFDLDLDLDRDLDSDLDLLLPRDPEADWTEEPDWERDEPSKDWDLDLDLDLRSISFISLDKLILLVSLDDIDTLNEFTVSKMENN